MKKIEFFKIEGDRINRIRKHCPKCGPGVFLADHKNRFSCGKCGYAEFKGGGKPSKPPIVKEKPVESPTTKPEPENLPVKEPPQIEESPIEATPIDETKDNPPVEPIPEPPEEEASAKEDKEETEKKGHLQKRNLQNKKKKPRF